jgi:DNA modification methylase
LKKPSRAEKEAGCEHLPVMIEPDIRNGHTTVKPIALMRYLCRLVTPPGGHVCDPFMGSGTTGIGAKLGGFDFTGCELDPRFVDVSRARIKYAVPGVKVEGGTDPETTHLQTRMFG